MKKAHKFLLSVLVAVFLLMGSATLNYFSESDINLLGGTIARAATYSGTCGTNVRWSYNTSTYSLTISGTGMMNDYGNSDRPWESYEDSIKTVVIDDGVTTIGNFAFYDCSSLASITIPDSVTSIGYNTFIYCISLKNVYYTGDVAGWCAISFSDSDSNPMYCAANLYIGGELVTELVIPDSVTSIGNYAFHGCSSLASITIPNSVTTIGNSAFSGCDSLTNITVDSNNQYYSNDGYGVLFNKDKTTLIQYPAGKEMTCYIIPDSVTIIGYEAFYDCTGLTSVTISNSVTSIDNSAFYYCSGIKELTIPISTYISLYAFERCNNIEKITLTKGDGTVTNYTYSTYSKTPWYISGCSEVVIEDGVTGIGNYMFYGRTGLTSITIPDSVTSIGNYAFYGCSSFASVTIPDSVISIGSSAFESCTGLTSVTIGNGVTSIGISAFKGCSLLNNVYYIGDVADWCAISFSSYDSNPMYYADNLYIGGSEVSGNFVIPDGITSIGSYAFYNRKGIESITIPDSVTSIGNYAFYNCSGIKELSMPISAKIYNSSTTFGGCTNIEKIAFTKGNGTVQNYTNSTGYSETYYQYTPWYISNSLQELVIEDGVAAIGSFAFYNCSSLENVYYTGDVAGWCAISFSGYYSNPMYYAHNIYIGGELVTELVIPDSVTSIGNYAFYCCSSLASVTIPDSVISIGKYAFYDCTGLTSITIPDSVTSIGEYAFYCCSLASVTIPDSVTTIGGGAFCGCDSLKSVTIGNSVTIIGDSAFRGCDSLKSVTIPDSVTTIGSGTFYNCTGLTSITIPDSVTIIGDSAFRGCDSLKSVAIPNSVTSIGKYAFYCCSSLASVTIPDSVTTIGDGAFLVCYSLTNITVDSNNQYYSNDEYGVLFNKDKTTLIQYPAGKEMTYYIIPDSVTIIGAKAFYDCTGLTNVTIGNSVTSIGDYAFYNCNGLTSVTIGNSVTSIGKYALYDCTGLTSITIPDSVTSISDYAFYNCSGIKELTMPISAKIYNSNTTFGGCTNIERIAFTKGNGTVQNYTYSTGYLETYYQYTPWYNSRNSLKEIVIEDGVTGIGNYMFYGSTGLTSITIPDSVKSIGKYAFYDCTGLTSITIPDSVTSIGDYAFYNCRGIKELTMSMFAPGYSSFGECANIEKLTLTKGNGTGRDYTYSSCSKTPWYISRNSLKEIVIEDGVRGIGSYTFYGNTGLTSITIPDSVKSIGSWAFYACKELACVHYSGTEDQWDAISFDSGNDFLRNAEFHFCEKEDGVSPTCTTDGYTYACFCSQCDKYIAVKKIIPATGHNYQLEETPATCTTAGEKIYTCECGDSYSEVITALGHNPEYYKVEPTCTQEGYECYKCTRCGTEDVRESIPVIKHNYILTGETPATCTTAGEKIYTCECGDSYSEVITALGHNPEYYKVEPTCTQEGYECYKCTLCGTEYARENLEVLQHTSGEWEEVQPATCTQTGTKIKKCTACGIETHREIISVIPHSHVVTNETPETCTTAGVRIYTCECGDTYTEKIPAPGHRPEDYRVEPTCTEEGYECYKCTVCGTEYEKQTIPTAGHSYEEEIITEPTCTEVGLKRCTCSVCGESYDEEIPVAEHTITVIRKEPTCTSIGNEQYLCTVCGNMVGDMVILPKADHTYGEWNASVEPTATKDGYGERSCSVCGASETTTIPKFAQNCIVDGNIIYGVTSGLDVETFNNEYFIVSVATAQTTASSENKIGTGSFVAVTATDGTASKYDVVLFGDVNGDGWYDGQDAVLVSCLANGMLTQDDVSEAVWMAADCNHDGVIDQLDVALLNQAGTLLANVDQTKPAEVLLETSAEYVEYLDLIDQTFEIEVEDDEATENEATEDESNDSTSVVENSIFAVISEFIAMLQKLFDFIFSFVNV